MKNTKGISKLINKLNDNSQDFEFYPTTSAMINIINKDIESGDYRYSSRFTALDIGAGNGKVLSLLKTEGKKYAIEKSPILQQELTKAGIISLGVDFYENTLIDKEVDIVFCNPPYSEYASWVSRIIKEANSKIIYLVIPSRWKDDEKIKLAIKARSVSNIKTLAKMDFLESEDRKARAKVDIVRIVLDTMVYETGYLRNSEIRVSSAKSAFDTFFDEFICIKTVKNEGETPWAERERKEQEIKGGLVKSKNYVETIVEFYKNDLNELTKNYQKIGEIDPELLSELGVKVDDIKEAIKVKIQGLKYLYWNILFDKYEPIAKRLIASSKKKLFDMLRKDRLSLDFNESNIYNVTLWCIEKGNMLIEDQLKEYFIDLFEDGSIRLYKSNKHFYKNDWRGSRGTQQDMRDGAEIKYALEYRIVKENNSNFDRYDTAFSERLINFVSDTYAIANTLGYEGSNNFNEVVNVSNCSKNNKLYFVIDGKRQVFFDIRIFKNGNIHLKFNQKFINALNVNAAKLFGWITNPNDIEKEEVGITKEEAEKVFSNNKLFSFPLMESNILLAAI